MFNADRKAKPRRKDDGSVDFHQLDNINHVCKGDLLAILHQADLGENGRNVLDEVIKPASVSHTFLKYGKIYHQGTLPHSKINYTLTSL